MNGPDVLSSARHQLAIAIIGHAAPASAPLTVSPWIAMSLLQKAICRGRLELAQRAAATLQLIAPGRLWRRLGCIAYEDIGVADLETVALVTTALKGRRFRARLGGEWQVASFLVGQLVNAPKCRSSDDLLLAAENHPTYQQSRLQLAEPPTTELIAIATGDAPLPERALALWFALGTDRRPSAHLPMRRGEPQTVFDHLCEAGLPHTVVEIAREGFRKSGEILCPFVSLLAPLRRQETTSIVDDEFPAEALIRGVPCWAYDLYSREGRAALQQFLQGGTETARWVRAHTPVRQRVHFLGTIVFRVEGGVCKKRLRWPTGDELRRLVDIECHGAHCPDATEVLDLMRADIAALNEVRSHVC